MQMGDKSDQLNYNSRGVHPDHEWESAWANRLCALDIRKGEGTVKGKAT